MSNLRLTFACGPYDRTQALRDGTIRPEGIELTYLTLQPAEIFWLMQHEYAVKPSDVEWVQGRADRLGHRLPPDVKLIQAPAGAELGDMLERGEIDFMMTANNPLSFRRGAPNVRRLFPNYREAEQD